MATYEPYIKRAAGDFIAADDWNEIQQRGREDLATHDHSGGLKGPKLTGAAIAADAVLTVKELNADEINLSKTSLGKRLTQIEDKVATALTAKGGVIEGDLSIAGDLTVKGTIKGDVPTGGGGGGATFGLATMTLGKSFPSKDAFISTGLTVTITLAEASIVSATANFSGSSTASAQLAFGAILPSSRTRRASSVPFVPAESPDGGTSSAISTSSSGPGQIDPSTYLKVLEGAASLGDDGVGVGVVIPATKTALPISFTQITALPSGTYTVDLLLKGEASLANVSVFVNTQIADLSPFDTTR
ncbi:hypothetical protein L6R46_30135 [Myxococcota bacterium]|jgi:hypothetical protein|nr:hypothetical protein [Myxococcota bacterium]